MTMRVLILMKVLSHWPPQPLNLQNGHPLRLMKTTIWINRSLHQVTTAENSSFSRNVWISFSSFVPYVGENATIKKNVVGTMLVVSRVCICGEAFTWESQSLTGSIPTGNLVLSAAIFFSGCSNKQSLVMFQHANVSCFSERTFHNIQQYYLVPAVERVGMLTKMPYLI